jgi:hypothetical protein
LRTWIILDMRLASHMCTACATKATPKGKAGLALQSRLSELPWRRCRLCCRRSQGDESARSPLHEKIRLNSAVGSSTVLLSVRARHESDPPSRAGATDGEEFRGGSAPCGYRCEVGSQSVYRSGRSIPAPGFQPGAA